MLAVRDSHEVGGATSTKQPFAAAVAIRQEITPTCDVMVKGGRGGGIDGEHEKVKQKSKGVFLVGEMVSRKMHFPAKLQ